MTEELEQLTAFKAAFDNLAENSLQSSDSDEQETGNIGSIRLTDDAREAKWKQRARKLQQYTKWQLAEAEAQVCECPSSLEGMGAQGGLYAKDFREKIAGPNLTHLSGKLFM